nr:hypothetical protein [uncultured bacterium]
MTTGTVQHSNVQRKLALSVEEAAEATSLSKSYIRNEIRDKKLKARRAGKRILILTDDLMAYLLGQE